jgi:hypothetical protein
VRELLKSRPRVKVLCELAHIAYVGGGTTPPLVTITAVNIGHRPVRIISGGIRFSNGAAVVPVFHPALGRTALPATLSDGESVYLHFDIESLGDSIRQRAQEGALISAAFVRDAAGREYRGRLDPALWTQLQELARS